MDLNTDPASCDPSTAWPKDPQHSVVIKQASQADFSDEERAAAIYMAKRASNTAIAYAIAAEKAKYMPRAIIAAVRAQEAAAKAAAAWAVVESLSATSQAASNQAMSIDENETPADPPTVLAVYRFPAVYRFVK
jgi:cyanate lyase